MCTCLKLHMHGTLKLGIASFHLSNYIETSSNNNITNTDKIYFILTRTS